jgi:hypothetical protein
MASAGPGAKDRPIDPRCGVERTVLVGDHEPREIVE